MFLYKNIKNNQIDRYCFVKDVAQCQKLNDGNVSAWKTSFQMLKHGEKVDPLIKK